MIDITRSRLRTGSVSVVRNLPSREERREMIVCSCNVISDADIEAVLLDLMNRTDAPVPTPGLVFREMKKRMSCCGCAPLAVSVIYQRLEALEAKGLVCRYRCADVRGKLRLIVDRSGTPLPTSSPALAAPAAASAR